MPPSRVSIVPSYRPGPDLADLHILAGRHRAGQAALELREVQALALLSSASTDDQRLVARFSVVTRTFGDPLGPHRPADVLLPELP